MASLEKRNQTYRIVFMYGGKHHGFSLKTGDRREAESLAGGVEKPKCASSRSCSRSRPAWTSSRSSRTTARSKRPPPPESEPITFAQFRDRYLATHEGGGMEGNSLGTVRIHLGHLVVTLGDRFPIDSLAASNLQSHITRREAVKRAGGRRLSPTTIRKELASLRAAWNWGAIWGLSPAISPTAGWFSPRPMRSRPS